MSTRIAFTSCSDPLDEPVQTVWDRIADQKPDHLVLLGDQIYMDFGILFIHSENPPLGRPSRMGNLEFAQAMHLRYQRQWDIMRRSRLAGLPALQIHGIWDDHDFAWNNSHGDGGSNHASGPGHKRDPVNRDKQMISRRLMRDFFQALHEFAAPYPPNPVLSDDIALAEDLRLPMTCPSPRGTSALGRVELGGGACLLLTDCRSFRTRPDAPSPGAFGEAQWRWLDEQVDGGGVTLLACATTLDEGGIPLDQFPDYDRLVALAQARHARMLCLTGDVHKLDWRHHGPRIYEAVASGAARSTFGLYGAFGVADIGDAQVTVRLHLDSDEPRLQRVIDRDSWREV